MYMVNSWNNTQEVNTGKTYGTNGLHAEQIRVDHRELSRWSAGRRMALYGALGKPNNNWRQLEDAVITITPNAKWTLVVNGDYAYGDKYPISATKNSQPVDWWGIAGYGKYAISANSYFAVRYEQVFFGSGARPCALRCGKLERSRSRGHGDLRI